MATELGEMDNYVMEKVPLIEKRSEDLTTEEQ